MSESFSACISLIADRLVQRGERLATAESCTGGWLAKVCTDLPGSSTWFDRGVVTYSNTSKQDLLDVSEDTLERHGAVSEQTVHAMAVGIVARSEAQWGIATSGVAGPGGGSPDKPVGTVWLAWAGPDNWWKAVLQRFEGDRDAVRRQAVAAALNGLLDSLRER